MGTKWLALSKGTVALTTCVIRSGALLQLLGKAASLFFPHGLHGDFYPSVGVCLSGLPELLIFILPLIGSLKRNVITLVIC